MSILKKNSNEEAVVEIDGIWYYISDKSIVLDRFTGNYNKRSNLKMIVLEYDRKNGKVIDSYYTSEDCDFNKCVQFYDSNVNMFELFESKEVAIKNGFRESYKTGAFVPKEISEKSLSQIGYTPFDFPLIKNTTENLIKFGQTSPSYISMEGKKYTMGVEFECSRGSVPRYVRRDLNINCVFDGSISGDSQSEYTTGVLKGDAGMNHLYQIVKELSLRCRVNASCSIHVHLGNIRFSQEFIVCMYKLALMLENEIFSMMPLSRRDNEYCRAIDNIKMLDFEDKDIPYEVAIRNIYNTIFRILSVGEDPSRCYNKSTNHPMGSRCGYDRRTPRYWWLNFIPTIFDVKQGGNESKTIEFRIHSATLNFGKVKNWILIIMGIVSFAENYRKIIINNTSIKLNDVLKLTYPKKHKGLIEYIDDRKALFSGTHSKLVKNEDNEFKKRSNGNKESLTLKQLINY